MVSNHGARQLDGVSSTIEALPEVAHALQGSKVELFLDGGVRRGTDVLKVWGTTPRPSIAHASREPAAHEASMRYRHWPLALVPSSWGVQPCGVSRTR